MDSIDEIRHLFSLLNAVVDHKSSNRFEHVLYTIYLISNSIKSLITKYINNDE
jgi:hypothetical protein